MLEARLALASSGASDAVSTAPKLQASADRM